MKTPTLSCGLVLLLALAATLGLHASDEAVIAAVRAAEDERTSATIAADKSRLEAIYSDQLHYAHSNGVVDTKATYLDSLLSGKSDYVSFEHKTREFVPVGPGIVLMKGRVLVTAGAPGQLGLHDLNYLAVWREEGGKWRFLAWQSCRNVPSVPVGPPAAN